LSGPAAGGSEGGADNEARGGYLWWLMIVLLLVNILNFIDRQSIFILAESIKADLGLSDTDIGLLGGVAFAIVYSTMAVPLARMAEIYGRKRMLAILLASWSGLTALGGLAQNFTQLVLARLGVAAGEAGGTPTAHAIISASFPERRRAMAIAFYSLGVPLGTMTGLILGGWINEVASWRMAMIALGLPGILLAVVVWFTIREPAQTASPADKLSMTETLKMLWQRRSFRQTAYGLAVYSMGANAAIVFGPAFLMRTYGLNSASAGLSLGLVYGVIGVAGTLAGGWLGDRFGARDARWRLWLPAIVLIAAMPVTLGAWFASTATLSVAFIGGTKFANLFYLGPIFAAMHAIAPPRARGTASAGLLFFNSLIGASLGPLITGVLSDWLEPAHGPLSLRYALCFVVLTQIWAAAHFFLAARSVRADAELAK